LTNFIESKRKSGDYLRENAICEFALQLLSAIDYLHSKGYVLAPGAINSNYVFFTQTYNNILLDIGRGASSISDEWLLQNSKQLIANRKYI
jgi:serine/threonine protein kinase